ncbi:hypothetical protein DFH09DRAFT_1373955 [Mycena vulgaris]|nr:hypothetical protein DFH09DRAFT_1373955 [Mycena vulgaris]
MRSNEAMRDVVGGNYHTPLEDRLKAHPLVYRSAPTFEGDEMYDASSNSLAQTLVEPRHRTSPHSLGALLHSHSYAHGGDTDSDRRLPRKGESYAEHDALPALVSLLLHSLLLSSHPHHALLPRAPRPVAVPSLPVFAIKSLRPFTPTLRAVVCPPSTPHSTPAAARLVPASPFARPHPPVLPSSPSTPYLISAGGTSQSRPSVRSRSLCTILASFPLPAHTLVLCATPISSFSQPSLFPACSHAHSLRALTLTPYIPACLSVPAPISLIQHASSFRVCIPAIHSRTLPASPRPPPSLPARARSHSIHSSRYSVPVTALRPLTSHTFSARAFPPSLVPARSLRHRTALHIHTILAIRDADAGEALTLSVQRPNGWAHMLNVDGASTASRMRRATRRAVRLQIAGAIAISRLRGGFRAAGGGRCWDDVLWARASMRVAGGR